MTKDPKITIPSENFGIAFFVRQYLVQVVTIQNAMLQRLLDERHDLPLDLAEVFEDAANTYMDLSVMISERHTDRLKLIESRD